MAEPTDPSPEDIAQATAMIRAGWSEDERLKRRHQMPMVRVSRAEGVEIRAAAEDALSKRLAAARGP